MHNFTNFDKSFSFFISFISPSRSSKYMDNRYTDENPQQHVGHRITPPNAKIQQINSRIKIIKKSAENIG